MLNQRQSFILKDLEAAKEPITAKALAAKYNISLRTIRNDINEISDYVNISRNSAGDLFIETTTNDYLLYCDDLDFTALISK